MDMNEFMASIKDMINDVRKKDFTYSASLKVPSLYDSDLTYESGEAKKASTLKRVCYSLISEIL